MPRLLIAGYGFLGEAIQSKFASAGWEVVCLSRSGDGTNTVACDLSDLDAVMALEGEYDLLIHCAATRGGGVDVYRKVYLNGCRNLRFRFPDTPLIFTSSTSVYGQSDHLKVSEKSLAIPVAQTSRVLKDTEDEVVAHGGVVLRLSALIGPGRCHTLKTFLNGTARIDGDGARVLNMVHRDDVAEAFFLLAPSFTETSGQVFNVSAVSITQLECYQQLASDLGRALPAVANVSPDGARTQRRGSTSKIVDSQKIRDLGWTPLYGSVPLIFRNEML